MQRSTATVWAGLIAPTSVGPFPTRARERKAHPRVSSSPCSKRGFKRNVTEKNHDARRGLVFLSSPDHGYRLGASDYLSTGQSGTDPPRIAALVKFENHIHVSNRVFACSEREQIERIEALRNVRPAPRRQWRRWLRRWRQRRRLPVGRPRVLLRRRGVLPSVEELCSVRTTASCLHARFFALSFPVDYTATPTVLRRGGGFLMLKA